MINFNANRSQFLSELTKLLTQHGLEDCPFDSYEPSPHGRQYAHEQVAFSVFRNNETWLIHITNLEEYSVARIVIQYSEFVVCMKINLGDDIEERIYPNFNVLDWVASSLNYFNQVDWYYRILAEDMYAKIHEREKNGLKHYSINITKQRRDKHTIVNLVYHGSENPKCDKVVLVFNVTNSDGRNDTYSVSIRNQSRSLNYFMGLYRRSVYSKFLNEVLDREGSNHDVLGVFKVEPGMSVCITRPVANDRATYDQHLEIGRAYVTLNRERSMDSREYITVLVDGESRDYDALHFFTYKEPIK